MPEANPTDPAALADRLIESLHKLQGANAAMVRALNDAARRYRRGDKPEHFDWPEFESDLLHRLRKFSEAERRTHLNTGWAGLMRRLYKLAPWWSSAMDEAHAALNATPPITDDSGKPIIDRCELRGVLQSLPTPAALGLAAADVSILLIAVQEGWNPAELSAFSRAIEPFKAKLAARQPGANIPPVQPAGDRKEEVRKRSPGPLDGIDQPVKVPDAAKAIGKQAGRSDHLARELRGGGFNVVKVGRLNYCSVGDVIKLYPRMKVRLLGLVNDPNDTEEFIS